MVDIVRRFFGRTRVDFIASVGGETILELHGYPESVYAELEVALKRAYDSGFEDGSLTSENRVV